MSEFNPLVSIVMATFKDSKYLEASIHGILKQTYTNFELIIIKDNCGDAEIDRKMDQVVERLKDDRIKYIVNPECVGFLGSLNIGLDTAKGKYIARIDSDDISMPNRLDRQVDFLEKHANIDVVGTSDFSIDENNVIQEYRGTIGNDDKAVRNLIFFNNPLSHPSVMFRKSILRGSEVRYENAGGMGFSEDYIMWSRLLPDVKYHVLDEPLILYRIDKNTSRTFVGINRLNEQVMAYRRILSNLFNNIGVDQKHITDELIYSLFNLSDGTAVDPKQQQAIVKQYIDLIMKSDKLDKFLIMKNGGYFMIRMYGFSCLLRYPIISFCGLLRAVQIVINKKKGKHYYDECNNALKQVLS